MQNKSAEKIIGKSTVYPHDKEKILVFSIACGDIERANAYLNEILGYIFNDTENGFTTIKVRSTELTVMVSRAALDAGGDSEKIFAVTANFLESFNLCSNLEEICRVLTETLRILIEESHNSQKIGRANVINKAIAFINANYMSKITLNDVAACVYLSPSHFSKLFKMETGSCVCDFINRTRIDKSRVLLLDNRVRMVDIVEYTGFYDQSYFSKIFKKVTGVTPKQYRAANGVIKSDPVKIFS